MQSKTIQILALVAVCLALVSVASAHHKKFYNQPHYQQPEPCVCECGRPQYNLPSKPYHGNAGYHQPPPHRPSGGGYGNAGSYAVAGSYGSGGSQVSGGY